MVFSRGDDDVDETHTLWTLLGLPAVLLRLLNTYSSHYGLVEEILGMLGELMDTPDIAAVLVMEDCPRALFTCQGVWKKDVSILTHTLKLLGSLGSLCGGFGEGC